MAAITGAVMNSSMKPVAKSHSASGYVADEGSLRLRAQADRFVRTMETRHKIKQGGSGKPGGAGSGGPGGSGGHGGPAGPGGPGGRAGGPKGGHR